MSVECEQLDIGSEVVLVFGVDCDFDCVCVVSVAGVFLALSCESVCGVNFDVVVFFNVFVDFVCGNVWVDVVYEDVCALLLLCAIV